MEINEHYEKLYKKLVKPVTSCNGTKIFNKDEIVTEKKALILQVLSGTKSWMDECQVIAYYFEEQGFYCAADIAFQQLAWDGEYFRTYFACRTCLAWFQSKILWGLL